MVIASIGSKPANPPSPTKELKFGFPNERMMGSGAYRACWPDKLEIGIAPDYNFFVWREDHPYNPSLESPYADKVTRVNCDGLIHALALIHHLLDEHNIPLTQRGNVNE